MTRILILHASINLGHLQAAKAIHQAFTQRKHEQVQVEDVLAHGRPLFGRVYADSYTEISEKLPELWAFYYERSDQGDSQFSKRLSELVIRLGISGLDDFILDYAPDVILCTHFLPIDLLLTYRRKGKLTQPIYCIVTDYTGHVLWAYPEIEGYFVGSAETARLLTQRGVPEEIISITGIPVDPAIAEPKDLPSLRQLHQIGEGRVITLLGSGLATNHVEQIVRGLLERDITGTLLVPAGRNEEIHSALSSIHSTDRLELRVMNFIDYMDDLVALSDVVITKAGGLIVSEVLARHTPMIIVDPVPGQEEWNADHVVSVGAGLQVRLPDMVPVVVENLLRMPSYMQAIRSCAQHAGRPEAALKIADIILERHG
jgi:processive 1,2-diacylglycerol beta-glucosyltransferase